MQRTVGILGFDEVEALDFVGPYEVFTTAERVAAREGCGNLFRVISISQQPSFTASAGLTMLADCHPRYAPRLDLLIIPGGVTREAEKDAEINAWLQEQVTRVSVIASVCTGVFLLAKANLIQGREVTTHWEDVADLRSKYPSLKVVEGVRWVDSGTLVTSAGISAGIDMSLHLVERLVSRELAELTAHQMDYLWLGNDSR